MFINHHSHLAHPHQGLCLKFGVNGWNYTILNLITKEGIIGNVSLAYKSIEWKDTHTFIIGCVGLLHPHFGFVHSKS